MNAYKEYILDVESNFFANKEYSVSIDDSVIDEFLVYDYTQVDYAQLYGVDAGLHYHPHNAHWLHLESSFSNVFAEDLNGNPLPLIPQTRLNNRIKIDLKSKTKFRVNNLNIQYQYFFKQNRLKIAPWLFLAPGLFMFLTYVIWPIAGSISISFYEWDGLGVH